MNTASAILLCGGPSLVRTYPDIPPAGLVVAVNRAAVVRRCSVWACGDWPLLDAIGVAVAEKHGGQRPRLLTTAPGHAWLRQHCPAGDWNAVVEAEAFYDGQEAAIEWPMFTATIALWYCVRQGVKELDVYGADFGGGGYCDGTALSRNRHDIGEPLWTLERTIWQRISDRTGLVVRRHQAPPAT